MFKTAMLIDAYFEIDGTGSHTKPGNKELPLGINLAIEESTSPFVDAKAVVSKKVMLSSKDNHETFLESFAPSAYFALLAQDGTEVVTYDWKAPSIHFDGKNISLSMDLINHKESPDLGQYQFALVVSLL